MGISISVVSMIIFSVVSVLIGLVLEFLYTEETIRTERLEYEDDEYYYYVKAVPKALVATSERSIKKINAEPPREDKNRNERVVKYNEPLFQDRNRRNSPENAGRSRMSSCSEDLLWTMLILKRNWRNP